MAVDESELIKVMMKTTGRVGECEVEGVVGWC